MPVKWDDKSERDLLLAMRMAEHGSSPITKGTWAKVEAYMRAMGHNEATEAGVSQRWQKTILRNFQAQHPDATTNATNAPAPAAAPTPARRAKKRATQKREADQEEQHEGGEDVEKAPAAKKQKN
ncbi:hypothetical protein F5Y07DRAFT_53593 [Xylaria sp. FL0933]|nr:hypothetical protein F5Y07DRAFT_53593 [Xylaria sp. FL0933]